MEKVAADEVAAPVVPELVRRTKRSELTVEIGREYNRSQEILPEEFTDIFRNNTCIRKEESG